MKALFLLILSEFITIFARKFSISGFDSGAWAAVQLQLAYSKDIIGVGIIGGGIYGCSIGSSSKVHECSQKPWITIPSTYYSLTKSYQELGYIDNLKFAANHKIWLFSGQLDIDVYHKAMENLLTYYEYFVDPKNIKSVFYVHAGHGIPVIDTEIPCAYSGFPYIISCGMDSAGQILRHIYGHLKPKLPMNFKNLYKFDQTLFFNQEGKDISSLAEIGYIYITDYCMNNECKIHVMLHGCNQNYEATNGDSLLKTGYLEWAEGNNIVVIFPQVSQSKNNLNACWDWWGYTGANYLAKDGIQMKVIYDMVQKLPKVSSSSIQLIAIFQIFLIFLL
ncbi:unnamed protein product [Blepharisma stoltei]|uniref:Uncharacterized protein n=1 Tax=Blepharisma stoltei TaxID=1481888 RepID=A0AAU9JBE0_9CILI|nr:unnamed protein product [Blepharisma stoltei]